MVSFFCRPFAVPLHASHFLFPYPRMAGSTPSFPSRLCTKSVAASLVKPSQARPRSCSLIKPRSPASKLLQGMSKHVILLRGFHLLVRDKDVAHPRTQQSRLRLLRAAAAANASAQAASEAAQQQLDQDYDSLCANNLNVVLRLVAGPFFLFGALARHVVFLRTFHSRLVLGWSKEGSARAGA